MVICADFSSFFLKIMPETGVKYILYTELSLPLRSNTSVNAWEIVPKSHDHHYHFQSHDQNISAFVDGMLHSILHFVYHVIVFNLYLRKIVLQEVGRKSILRDNWFEISDLFSSLLIFTIIKTILMYMFLLFLNFTKIL